MITDTTGDLLVTVATVLVMNPDLLIGNAALAANITVVVIEAAALCETLECQKTVSQRGRGQMNQTTTGLRGTHITQTAGRGRVVGVLLDMTGARPSNVLVVTIHRDHLIAQISRGVLSQLPKTALQNWRL